MKRSSTAAHSVEIVPCVREADTRTAAGLRRGQMARRTRSTRVACVSLALAAGREMMSAKTATRQPRRSAACTMWTRMLSNARSCSVGSVVTERQK